MKKVTNWAGFLFPASAPEFKEADNKLINWYRKQIKSLPITVKLKTEVLDLSKIEADEIIIATGSKENTLKVTGADKCISAIDYLSGKTVGEKVAIIGGGLSGCEIAYDLFLKGKKPIIVESQNDLMVSKSLCLANSSYLRDFFKVKKVPVFLESSVIEIGKNFIKIKDKNGEIKKVLVDDVIIAIGYKPNPIAKPSKHIHIVGDALKVGNLRTVVWRAWEVAQKI